MRPGVPSRSPERFGKNETKTYQNGEDSRENVTKKRSTNTVCWFLKKDLDVLWCFFFTTSTHLTWLLNCSGNLSLNIQLHLLRVPTGGFSDKLSTFWVAECLGYHLQTTAKMLKVGRCHWVFLKAKRQRGSSQQLSLGLPGIAFRPGQRMNGWNQSRSSVCWETEPSEYVQAAVFRKDSSFCQSFQGGLSQKCYPPPKR